MVFIPFFYFLLLFFYIMRQNGWDVCAYVAFLYVLTSLFSVLIHILDYQVEKRNKNHNLYLFLWFIFTLYRF